jgi:hypothetical protein
VLEGFGFVNDAGLGDASTFGNGAFATLFLFSGRVLFSGLRVSASGFEALLAGLWSEERTGYLMGSFWFLWLALLG